MMARKLLNKGGIIDYDTSFLTKDEADSLYSLLQNKVAWEQLYYNNYGKKPSAMPRLTAWMADKPNMAYSYSGVVQKVLPWLPELLDLKQRIEEVSGADYNSALLNYYVSGANSVGAHADSEKELGNNPNIASISLGATRSFQLQSKNEHMVKYELVNGSLLIMSGETQAYWLHSIPKDFDVKEGRINITFRKFYE